MPASARTVSLTEHQQRFLDAQVQAGRHGSTSEVVREALRRYEDDVLREEAHLAYLKRLGNEGEADIAAGRYVDVPRDGLKDYLRSLGRRAREDDLLGIFEDSAIRFARDASIRYEDLVGQVIFDLVEDQTV